MLCLFLIILEDFTNVTVPINFCIMAIIIIAILFFSLIVMWSQIIFYKEKIKSSDRMLQQSLKFVLADTQETIAKDIHDNVNTLLSVIKLKLTKAVRNYDDQVLSIKLIEESMDLVDESVYTIRNIAKELLPPTLKKLGYEKGVSELCDKITNSSQIKIGLILSENEVRLSPPKELQLYRMTQEVLNNIVKHSGVTDICISIKSNEKGVSTIISYYGFGITTEMVDELCETGKGCGLKSIQQRADTIDASVNYIMIGANEFKTTIDVPVFKNYDKNSCS